MDDSSVFIRARLRFAPATDGATIPVQKGPPFIVADAVVPFQEERTFATAPQPLTIWAVSDGRPSVDDQVMGLAEAVARLTPAHVERKILRWKDKGFARRPTWMQFEPRGKLADPLDGPWPDLWIAAGRATLPFSLRVKTWSQGRSFVVQAQDPRWSPKRFDAVIPPRHDRVRGGNVIEITGQPHRVTALALKRAYDAAYETFESLPRPRVAVLVGGGANRFDVSEDRARKLAAEIALAVETEGGSVMLAFSPDTPEPARDIIARRLASLPSLVWDGAGDDPRVGFLAAADYVLVSEDLLGAASEAAVTGAPVFVLKIDGYDANRRRFHEELEKLDVARPFGGQLYRWAYEPLNETDRAAARILRRLRDRETPLA
ncbi:MAG TPA: mitochondrial fission ELM1 family protein [Caulobacteraceae bacterium]|nr:mitochondrial fission ELM1 family protein [Caulobacteraceae bacterium]